MLLSFLYCCRTTESVAKETTPQTVRFQDRHSLLTRERIGFLSSPRSSPQQTDMESGSKATPTNASAGLFVPSRPSPLSYSVTSNRPPVNSSMNPAASSQTRSSNPKSIFSHQMASELVDAKKNRLSLESVRKKAVDQIISPPSKISKRGVKLESPTVSIVKTPLSSTMVRLPPPSMATAMQHQTTQASAALGGSGGTYRFSPGKIISTPPVEPFAVTSVATEPTYMFSPPMTRSFSPPVTRLASAARKRAEASEMGGRGSSEDSELQREIETESSVRRKRERETARAAVSRAEQLPGIPESSSQHHQQQHHQQQHHQQQHHQQQQQQRQRVTRSATRTGSMSSSQSDEEEQIVSKPKTSRKTVRSRGRRAVSAQPVFDPDPVHLVSPPSRHATPTTTTAGARRSLRPKQPALHSMQSGHGTRRSTRLLQDTRK